MSLVIWLVVGLVAGLLASSLMGGIGYGLLGDVIIGMVGAVLGGWLFAALNIRVPVEGLPGTVLVAFVGSLVLLGLIKTLRPRRSTA